MYEELIVPFFDKYNGSYSKGVLPSLEEVLRDFFDQKSIYKKLHQDNSLHSDINYLNSLKELHKLVGKIYYAYIHYFLEKKKVLGLIHFQS